MIERVVLIGFSGTGKSSTGHLVAGELGWSSLEMDSEIERREESSIPDIFERHGEGYFRGLESELLAEGVARDHVVIVTGGGAPCSDDAWKTLGSRPGTLVIGFHAAPEEILRRIERHKEAASQQQTTRRPMLDASDPLRRIQELMASRERFYRRADVAIHVGERTPEQTASDICEMVRLANGGTSTVTLAGASEESRITVGIGVRETLGERLAARWPKARRAWLGVDEHVTAAHADWLQSLQQEEAIIANLHPIASGEGSKSLAGLEDLFDWMIGGGVERNDVAVAVGGGVTGDLVGFAAATALRGIGLVQAPTTLLSMVDSSVGGKTGINHKDGKNLIGAFYQPPLVLVDSVFLRSLPERELRSGFAEVIKHGVIQTSVPGQEADFLYDVLERNTERLLRLEEPLTSWVIRQNIALKAAVVEADERESHLRQILNFGHTIGHGIEAAGYALLHGEAIAVGMVAATTISVEKGLVEPFMLDRLVSLLTAFGLPVRASFDPATVRAKMAKDKKKSAGVQQWVLPVAGGGVEIRTDVSDEEIARALESVRMVTD